MTYTLPQIVAAHDLARAFGHSWGLLPPPPAATGTVSAVAAHTRAASEAETRARCASMSPEDIEDEVVGDLACLGVEAPSFNAVGQIEHTTGRRRLSWRVRRSGAVVVTVHRPAGDALRVAVPADGSPPVVTRRGSGATAPERRHWEAALRCVLALRGEEVAGAWLWRYAPEVALAKMGERYADAAYESRPDSDEDLDAQGFAEHVRAGCTDDRAIRWIEDTEDMSESCARERIGLAAARVRFAELCEQ